MTFKCIIKDIKICPGNRRLQPSKSGRFFTSGEYKLSKKELTEYFGVARQQKLDPPYKVKIVFKTYKDIDAGLKVVLDSLQDAGVIDDDKNIHKLTVDKLPVKRGQNDSLGITVSTIMPSVEK